MIALKNVVHLLTYSKFLLQNFFYYNNPPSQKKEWRGRIQMNVTLLRTDPAMEYIYFILHFYRQMQKFI